ncbi:hypothetical protein, partial [Siccirubricoccus deserti]|uniref:hypothetical protein n=1 Tax=Siccirubricoccus deserti TaxID=2013562 RepID=UPI0021BD6EF2
MALDVEQHFVARQMLRQGAVVAPGRCLAATALLGSVRNSVFGRSVERHGQARALVKRWLKITANWALAMAHSRGG